MRTTGREDEGGGGLGTNVHQVASFRAFFSFGKVLVQRIRKASVKAGHGEVCYVQLLAHHVFSKEQAQQPRRVSRGKQSLNCLREACFLLASLLAILCSPVEQRLFTYTTLGGHRILNPGGLPTQRPIFCIIAIIAVHCQFIPFDLVPCWMLEFYSKLVKLRKNRLCRCMLFFG